MGFTPSPYNAIRTYYIAEEFARGNPALESNPMRYDQVKLNLPGDPIFDPTLPYVMKWNDVADAIAGDVKTFVDDLRGTGFSFENAWQVARQLGSRFQYLGIQEAARKRRPPSQTPGAWAGSVLAIFLSQLTKSVTQEKWEKGRGIIGVIAKLVRDSPDGRPEILFKYLESSSGFLVHLAMTFEDFMPLLKDFFNTMNSWRSHRGEDGYKATDKQWRHYLDKMLGSRGFMENEDDFMEAQFAPKMVRGSMGFANAVFALELLMSPEEVPKVMVRASNTLHVFYGFGDASGKGLGSGIARSDQAQLSVRIGVWGYTESIEESSNWREFTNVVESLEEEGEKGNLTNCIVFFFTDNSTVESALYSGSSSSKKLLGLVLRFKALQTKYSVVVHVSHVAGTRMIVQGTDGISRGKTNEGVMAGEEILSFIPTHQSAPERTDGIVEWIKSWLGDESILLSPMDWYGRGHDITGWTKHSDNFWRPSLETSKYIWSPAPASADAALEEFRVARIKRHKSTHVFVCPRLMTPMWLKQLYKASDIVFTVPVGQLFWPTDMHEPLLIGIAFPFIRYQPWQLRSVPKMYATNRQLSQNVGAWTPCLSTWCGGCYTSSKELKFFVATESQSPADQNDQERLDHKWKKKAKDEKDRYHIARRGDHLMVSFECDLCVFRKLKRRNPVLRNPVDRLTLITIRRVNLDALWARTTDTVVGNAGVLANGLRGSADFELTGPYLEPGPLPDYDHCGYEVAMQMVNDSRKSGRTSDDHKQFDSIRKLRTAFSNQVRASAATNTEPLALEENDGKKYTRIAMDPCASQWFARFSAGCKERMGQDTRPNRAFSLSLLHLLLNQCLSNAKSSTVYANAHDWIICGAYFASCYVGSLRGPEGRFMDLAGLIEYWETIPGVTVLVLRGKVKGEHRSRTHTLPCVNVTGSGINMKLWIGMLLSANKMRGLTDGPAFCDKNGFVLSSQTLDRRMHDALIQILIVDNSVFPSDIRTAESIRSRYRTFRTLRQTSAAQATNMAVSNLHTNVVNRWTKLERAGAKQASLPMNEHYAQIEELLPSFKAYTSKM